MTPDLQPPLCSGCRQAATLVPKITRFRRGDRVMPFEGFLWQCPISCRDPADGTAPYRFSTFELMRWEEERAAHEWTERFGEPMPPSQRARLPRDQRTVRLPILLTRAEAERLDRLRGDRSRADFIRGLIEASAHRAD